MFNFRLKKRRPTQSGAKWHSQFALTILGLIVLTLISIPLLRTIRKQAATRAEIAALEKQKKEFAAKNRNLNELLKYFQSDEFIEEQARSKLNYRKEGESLVVIKNYQQDKTASGTRKNIDIYNTGDIKNSQNKDNKYANIIRWWNYFFVS